MPKIPIKPNQLTNVAIWFISINEALITPKTYLFKGSPCGVVGRSLNGVLGELPSLIDSPTRLQHYSERVTPLGKV